ncbi:exodeoxyribonuclease VII small subunit [Cutibacterium granulosum]|uniref:exodeoxyribonuclease VII small subunit n=1 Tax=Cutibacterium granulosum TaxID=33011 RepID=UPI0027B9F9C0|nr:exodeoxyribonuclease VII small subunit [Cutibacterium granulosum]
MTDAPLPEDRDSATDRNAATDQTTLANQNVTEQLGNDEPPSGPTDSDEGLSYEQARDELISIVRSLENGGADLSRTMQLWERGEHLATICRAHLDGARRRFAQTQVSEEADAEEARTASDDPADPRT